ncbi:MAG: hypothetical protein U0559_09115 [Anaerolineae bacterium]
MARTVDADLAAARQVVADLRVLGFDLTAYRAASIEADKFIKSFDGLLNVIETKRAQFTVLIESATPAAPKKRSAKKSAAKKPAKESRCEEIDRQGNRPLRSRQGKSRRPRKRRRNPLLRSL